jgi:hypothetical protein
VGVEGHGVVVVVKALLDALVMPPLIAWFSGRVVATLARRQARLTAPPIWTSHGPSPKSDVNDSWSRDMALKPPDARSAPAKPWRSSISGV